MLTDSYADRQIANYAQSLINIIPLQEKPQFCIRNRKSRVTIEMFLEFSLAYTPISMLYLSFKNLTTESDSWNFN